MAAHKKKLFDDDDDDDAHHDHQNKDQDHHHHQQQNHKRIKTTRPSLSSVVKEVVMVNFLENFCGTLEPLLRRVVNEEVEKGLKRNMKSLTKSPSLRIQELHHHHHEQQQQQPRFKLIFKEKLSLPIFTGSKITDIKKNPLQLILVQTINGTDHRGPATTNYNNNNLPHSLKIEMVVLDGDFPSSSSSSSDDDDDDDRCNSSSTNYYQEFDKKIVKERTGRRPLLAGDLNVILRDGIASVGDLEFTDNSSWIRSRKFRIGAKVVVTSSTATAAGNNNNIYYNNNNNIALMIKPAMTESFVVKDHRGELYKKHYPPALNDEVWRLQKIGKDGAFHRKLSAQGINTVQDFLKLSVIEPCKLRKILGVGMSEKMWDVTHKHAWTCKMGNKHYIYGGSNYAIILNPVCQVIKAVINGETYSTSDLTLMHRGYIEKLLKEAHANWNTLEEVDAQIVHHHHHHQTPLLLTATDHHHDEMVTMDQIPVIKTIPHQTLSLTDHGSSSTTDHDHHHHHHHDPMSSTTSDNNTNNNEQLLFQYADWVPYLSTPAAENVGHYNFSESSSDGGDLH